MIFIYHLICSWHQNTSVSRKVILTKIVKTQTMLNVMVVNDSLTMFDWCPRWFGAIEGEGMNLHGFMVSPDTVLRYQQQTFIMLDTV